MEIIKISSNSDYMYPFSESIFRQNDIVYHGTNNIFGENIEKNGFNVNSQPYDLDDIKYLCDLYESLFGSNYSNYSKLAEYYSVLKGFTLRSDDSMIMKENCFSANYWNALNYASNLYGETLKYVFKFIDELNTLLTGNISPSNFNSSLPEHSFDDIISNLNTIKGKYKKLVHNSYPIVYAIKGCPEWFGLDKLNCRQFGSYFPGPIDLLCTDIITPDALVGRVDFINGVKRHDLSFEPSEYIPYI